ncbi:PKD domain-containing protein [Thermoflexibacter ruber]|uniref:Surface-anchored protein n=1 Tax=Thermoflexibacter ruber TaxID=1003 RepID=A0A1I2ISJ1_9BACT|nr:PKD domain-containing protein [Thermoflexibacter ruber]SFF44608.1 surface-anchored protein [Thermoflexibacter ruber]
MKKLIKKTLFTLILLLFYLFYVSACGPKSEPEPDAVASFTFSPSAPKNTETVTFTNTSQNAVSYEWSSSPTAFSSREVNPSFQFTQGGTYQITLRATGKNGKVVSTSQNLTVTEVPQPIVDFTFSPANPVVNEVVTFTSTVSNATSLAWSSNPAGFTSSAANPTFAFTQAGTYQITLKATGEGGTLEVSKTLTVTTPKPTADFSFSPNSPMVGEVVTFTSTVSNATSLAWSSSPAGFTSTAANPTFTFTQAGTYQITLKATGNGGTVEITKTITIRAAAVAADFSFSPAEPEEGQEVSFENKSTNADTYTWDFGGGKTSVEKNPKFTFDKAGDYTVKLTAKGAGGEATITKNIKVKAKAGTGNNAVCKQANKCNLPLCYVTKITGTVTGGTLNSTFEYKTIAGIKVVAKLTNTVNASGVMVSTTSTYDYDSQARNTTITTVTQNPFATTTVVTTIIYNGCVKTRENSSTNGVATGYTLFEYDASGRMTKSTNYNISNQVTGYTTFENFNAQDLPQTQKTFGANGNLVSTTTLTYQNCQPVRIIGKDSVGNTVLDQTDELGANGLIGKSTSISTISQAGINVSTTTIVTYEYQCE